MKPLFVTSAIVAVLAPVAVQAQTAQQGSKGAAQPQQQVQITNLPQICRIRESELVNVNLQILTRNNAASQQKDEALRKEILAPVPGLQGALREAEASWNRMDCARLLYGAR